MSARTSGRRTVIWTSTAILVIMVLSSLSLVAGDAAAAPSGNSVGQDLAVPSLASSSHASASQIGPRGAVPDYVLAGKMGQLPNNYFVYSPSEMREAYNVSPLLSDGITGKGVTIAIVDAWGDPTIATDLGQFDTMFGIPAPPSFNVLCIDGPCNYNLGVEYGWAPEISIDVEWAHAIAPGAAINLYIGSNNGNPLYDADLAAVEGASGTGPGGTGLGTPGVYHTDIISNSWGEPEEDLLSSQSYTSFEQFGYSYPWLDQVFQEAAAKGITVLFSTGDGGAFSQGDGLYGTLQSGGVQFPATDPFVTAVGGTSLYLSTTSGSLSIPPGNAKGTYGTETAWSWVDLNAIAPGYLAGTTGGYSTLYPQPLYQRGPGVSYNGARGVPDVAWDGDPYTGIAVNINGVYYGYGGTSIAAPEWAGSVALIDQKAGHSLGFLNPTLYSILNNPFEYAKAFHEVPFGNNNPYSATPGWDPLTGMGTPNVGALANILAGQSPPLSVKVTNNLNNHPVEPSTPARAYSYHDTITLRASVDDGMQVYGLVTACITSQSGALVACHIPMTWDSVSRTYVGTYAIKPTDPPGDWLAEVLVVNGFQWAVGYNGFQVGDGIQVDSPYPGIFFGDPSYTFEVGSTIPLSIFVQNPAGSQPITAGHGAQYFATFHLDTVSGKVEGSVPLTYNTTSQTWEGAFTIPLTADQGAWAVVFSGVDGHGNLAATAYTWVNVGLFIFPYTDTSTYVLGDTMTIFADTGVATGSFSGVVSFGPFVLGTVPLSVINASEGLWAGTFHISPWGPTGFYTVTVRGNDGKGDSGSFSEVVRVAPFFMTVDLSLSSKVVALKGGREVISVRITNGDGLPVTLGNVQAYIDLYFKNGTVFNPLASETTYQDGLPLTYHSATCSFVGVFTTSGPPGTLHGKYTVDIVAYDPIGDFGTAVGTFTVGA